MLKLLPLLLLMSLPLSVIAEDNYSLKAVGRQLDMEHLEAIPEAYKKTTGVTFQFEGWDNKDGGQWAKCRLVNPTDQPIYFAGHGIRSPFYHLQKNQEKEWKDLPLSFCGTDVYASELPPGRSVVYLIQLQQPVGKQRMRIGITICKDPGNLRDDKNPKVWTDAIQKN